MWRVTVIVRTAVNDVITIAIWKWLNKEHHFLYQSRKADSRPSFAYALESRFDRLRLPSEADSYKTLVKWLRAGNSVSCDGEGRVIYARLWRAISRFFNFIFKLSIAYKYSTNFHLASTWPSFFVSRIHMLIFLRCIYADTRLTKTIFQQRNTLVWAIVFNMITTTMCVAVTQKNSLKKLLKVGLTAENQIEGKFDDLILPTTPRHTKATKA